MNDIAFITVGAMGGQFHGSLLSMILDAGAMVQFVLLLLLFFSIVSWAIILMKFKVLKKVKKENDAFLEVYMQGNKLSEIFPESKKFQYSTIAEVFRSGYTELIKVTKVIRESLTGKAADSGDGISVEMNSVDNIANAMAGLAFADQELFEYIDLVASAEINSVQARLKTELQLEYSALSIVKPIK